MSYNKGRMLVYGRLVVAMAVFTAAGCASAPLEKETFVTGVRIHGGNIIKTRVSRDRIALGPALNIQVIDYDNRPGMEVAVIGPYAVAVLSLETGMLVDNIPYPDSAYPGNFPVMVKAGNGRGWDLASPGRRGQAGGLMNLDGVWRWRLTDALPPVQVPARSGWSKDSFGSKIFTQTSSATEFPVTRVKGIIPADLDGDGISEYVIESLTGVYCAAEDGELLWTKKSDRDTTAYAAVYREPGGDRDQALILAGVNMRNRQELRAFFYDHGGRLVRQVELPYRYRVNTVMEWRGRMAYFGDGMARDRKFGLAGFDGEILFEYEETHDVRPVHIVEARGVPVRLAKGSPPYLAVVSRFHRNASRSIFYIFSPEGRLLHKEVTMATIGLAVAQNADGATQAILASDGAGTLWSYKLAP